MAAGTEATFAPSWAASSRELVFQRYFNPSDPNVFDSRLFKMGADGRGAAGFSLPILSLKAKG